MKFHFFAISFLLLKIMTYVKSWDVDEKGVLEVVTLKMKKRQKMYLYFNHKNPIINLKHQISQSRVKKDKTKIQMKILLDIGIPGL